MGRISALTELTTLANDDYLLVLDSSANIAKKITVANAFGIPDIGWTPSGETWTYSSFSSTSRLGVVTVPTDATTKYSIGMWVRIAQSTGGTKYGKITAVTATTLTINFFDLYTLNNEAITTAHYSTQAQPFGAPGLPRIYVDSNSWTVIDNGISKRYVRSVAQSSINVSAADRAGFTNITLPVGVSTVATGYEVDVTFAGSTYPGNFFAGITKTTAITGLIGSNYNGGTLATGAFTLECSITPLS